MCKHSAKLSILSLASCLAVGAAPVGAVTTSGEVDAGISGSTFESTLSVTSGTVASVIHRVYDGTAIRVPVTAGTYGGAGVNIERVEVLGDGSVQFFFESAASPAAIDIKPGSDTNPVNPIARGVVAVAILGSDSLDVMDIDPDTLAFGPAGAALAHPNGPHYGDVNGDDFTDLVAHFRVSETGIAFGDSEACLSGEIDGMPATGGVQAGEESDPYYITYGGSLEGSPISYEIFAPSGDSMLAYTYISGSGAPCLSVCDNPLLFYFPAADSVPFESCDAITTPPCGVGFELALVLPPLMWLRRRRQARH